MLFVLEDLIINVLCLQFYSELRWTSFIRSGNHIDLTRMNFAHISATVCVQVYL